MIKSALRVFLLSFLVFGHSCKEEANKPVIRTLEVAEIATDGVTLNGEIRLIGGHPATDYGFVWASQTDPELSDKIYSFDKKPSEGEFSFRLSVGIEPGKLYYARVFVIVNGQPLYGNTVEFISLGSATPVILDFVPKQGVALDTVIITGENLGEIISATSIKIGETNAEIKSVSPTQLVFRIPLAYVTGSYPIVLTSIDKTTTSSTNFTLEGPRIESFMPTSGPAGTVVTISGTGFSPTASSNHVYFSDKSATVISASTTELHVTVPVNIEAGEKEISVDYNHAIAKATTLFDLTGPIITSISPESGPAGTVMTITGTGFSSTPTNNKVYFDDKQATVLSATSTSVEVTVPVINQPGNKQVRLEYQANSISPVLFNLTGPVITSISPSSTTGGTQITISGTGFSTIPEENTVIINSGIYTYGTVISATPSQLVVDIDKVYYTGNQSSISSNVSVEVKTIIAYSPELFTIKGPSISFITPTAQYEGRDITINGQNFATNGDNTVTFTYSGISPTSSDATSINVTIPFGDVNYSALPSPCPITITSAGYNYTVPFMFTILSPWKKLPDFPGGKRYGTTTFTIGSYSYVCMGIESAVGDKKDVWRFDPSNQSWIKMNDFPGPSRAFAFSFVVDGKAYVGGGGHYGGSSYDLISDHYDLWEYDPATDSWIQKSSFSPNGLSGKRFQATGIGNYGYFGANNFLYRYEPSIDQWWVFASPISFKDGGIAATIGNKGYFGLGVNSNNLWQFDPALDSWTEMTGGPYVLQPGFGVISHFELLNELYLYNYAYGLFKFNPGLNEWRRIPNIPSQLHNVGAFASSTKGYIVTGLNGQGFSNCFEFDPSY